MASPDAHFQATLAQMVEGYKFLGQEGRMTQVIVEHQRAESDTRRSRRCCCEGNERRRLHSDVVTHLEDVESGDLSSSGVTYDLFEVSRSALETKPERHRPERYLARSVSGP
jgi:hypothetical protein